MSIAKHQLVNQNSGNAEWYTPGWIVDAARRVMRSIDLDPASSATANEVVRAKAYFDFEADGLRQLWYGNVWMNHPFGRSANKKWINKLVSSYEEGLVTSACCLTWASIETSWFAPLRRYPLWFPNGRIRFLDERLQERGSATKSAVVTYLGPDVKRFADVFGRMGGVVYVPANIVFEGGDVS